MPLTSDIKAVSAVLSLYAYTCIVPVYNHKQETQCQDHLPGHKGKGQTWRSKKNDKSKSKLFTERNLTNVNRCKPVYCNELSAIWIMFVSHIQARQQLKLNINIFGYKKIVV